MLLSAVSVLVVAQSSSEIPEGPMNNHVELCYNFKTARTYKRNDSEIFQIFPLLFDGECGQTHIDLTSADPSLQFGVIASETC